MISVEKIIKQVRFKQKDNNETKFSDYDILESLNECIRFTNQRFSLQNADFLEKTKIYEEKAINEEINEYNLALPEGEEKKENISFAVTGIDLPEDYLSLVSLIKNNGYALRTQEAGRKVNGETYKIVGSKLFTGAGYFQMLYRAAIPSVSDLTDSVMLPEILLDGIVKCTGMILNNNADIDVMESAVDNNIVGLVSARRYTNTRVKMPFYC